MYQLVTISNFRRDLLQQQIEELARDSMLMDKFIEREKTALNTTKTPGSADKQSSKTWWAAKDRAGDSTVLAPQVDENEMRKEYVRNKANYFGQVIVVWFLQVLLCGFILYESWHDEEQL